MSFVKKDKIPNPDLQGIYHDVSDELNGIGLEDNERFSLGSWNSAFRNDKLNLGFLAQSISDISEQLVDPEKAPLKGRPVQIRFSWREFRGGLIDPYSAPVGSYLVHVNDANEIVNIVSKQGESSPEFRTLELGEIGVPADEDGNFDLDGTTRQTEPQQDPYNQDSRKDYHIRQTRVLRHYFNLPQIALQNGSLGEAYLPEETLISYDDGFAYIQERDTVQSGGTGRYSRFELKFDDVILQKMQDLVFVLPLQAYYSDSNSEPGGGYYSVQTTVYPESAALGIAGGDTAMFSNSVDDPRYKFDIEGDGRLQYPTHEIFFPRHFTIKEPNSDAEIVIGIDLWGDDTNQNDSTQFYEAPRPGRILRNQNSDDRFYPKIPVGPDFPFTINQDTLVNSAVNLSNSPFIFPDNTVVPQLSMAYPQTLHLNEIFNPQSSQWPSSGLSEDFYNQISSYSNDDLDSLGANSLFKFNFIQYNINPFVSGKRFVVNTYVNDEEKPLLFYDRESVDYQNTSFPLTIDINLGLFDSDFENVMMETPDNYLDFLSFYYNSNLSESDTTSGFYTGDSYYSYRVLQWGDEKKLLSDEELQEIYFSKFYDLDDETVNTNPLSSDNYFYRRFSQQQKEATPIQQKTRHTYITPGIKSIKIVVFRYTKNGYYILNTTFVTKNIIINDGTITTQDFEIFGGTDYNFLPLEKNQIIVGGLNENSKHVKSLQRISDFDEYNVKDYLSKGTNKEFINQFRDGLWGKSPGKLDLGNIRTFMGVKKLENHIGDFNINSGSIDNTLVSNIFIDEIDVDFKRDTTLELNPQKKDFSTLQNTVGTKKTAVLIGDYELEKKDDESPIIKKGVMNTSQIETDKSKQAI